MRVTAPDESGGPSAPSGGMNMMPFIVTLNSGKADPSTRRLIRSHARQTRNLERARPSRGQKARIARAEGVPLNEAIKSYAPQVPSRVGGDLSFTGIVGDIEDSILLNIFKVMPIAARLIFPLQTAMGVHGASTRGIYPIDSDPAVLHITAYAIEGLIDTVLRRQKAVNPRAMLHLQRGLILLRDRLAGDDADATISDATIAVVLKLASVSHFDGDYHASRQHMEGIRRMVDLRGGILSFRGGQDLLAEILRYDLAMALLNSEDPLFYVRPTEPPPDYPACLLSPMAVEPETVGVPTDEQLATSWRAMRRFCLLVNLGKQTKRPMRPDIIHQTTAAVMYRLLGMRFPPGSVDEAVRTGLLAFSHHVFLQWRDFKPSSTPFATSFRVSLATFEAALRDAPRMILWLLMVGAVAVFDEADCDWLKGYLESYVRRCNVTRWSDMHTLLRSMVWMDLLDEEPGKAVFQSLRTAGIGNASASIIKPPLEQ